MGGRGKRERKSTLLNLFFTEAQLREKNRGREPPPDKPGQLNHSETGPGINGVGKPLTGSDGVQQPRPKSMVGSRGAIREDKGCKQAWNFSLLLGGLGVGGALHPTDAVKETSIITTTTR